MKREGILWPVFSATCSNAADIVGMSINTGIHRHYPATCSSALLPLSPTSSRCVAPTGSGTHPHTHTHTHTPACHYSWNGWWHMARNANVYFPTPAFDLVQTSAMSSASPHTPYMHFIRGENCSLIFGNNKAIPDWCTSLLLSCFFFLFFFLIISCINWYKLNLKSYRLCYLPETHTWLPCTVTVTGCDCRLT